MKKVTSWLMSSAAIALFAAPGGLALAQDPPDPAAPTRWQVEEIDRVSQTIVLERDPPPPDRAGEQTLELVWSDYAGRMESESGFPVTFDAVRDGAPVLVWFDDEGDVRWIVFPSL